MHFDPGHEVGDRRRLGIEQSHGGGADKHELAGDQRLVDGAVEDVLGRDISNRPRLAEADPDPAMFVGRDGDAGNHDAVDAGLLVGADADRALPGRQTQHLDAQRGQDRAFDIRHQRYAAHDAVLLVGHVDHAEAVRRRLQLRNVPGQAGVLLKHPTGVAADLRDRGFLLRRRPADEGARVVVDGLGQHRPRRPDQCGKAVVAVRQSAQIGPHLVRDIADLVGQDRRRDAVRLGEDDVEADDHGTACRQVPDQPGDDRSRPRPLTDRG